MVLAYSSVIIAQLAEPDSDIKSTEQQNAWIGRTSFIYKEIIPKGLAIIGKIRT